MLNLLAMFKLCKIIIDLLGWVYTIKGKHNEFMFWTTDSWKSLHLLSNCYWNTALVSLSLKAAFFKVRPRQDISGSKDEVGHLKWCWQTINICEHHKFTPTIKTTNFPEKQLRMGFYYDCLPLWTKKGKNHLFSFQTALINLAEATKIAVSCRDDRITFLPLYQNGNPYTGKNFHPPT